MYSKIKIYMLIILFKKYSYKINNDNYYLQLFVWR